MDIGGIEWIHHAPRGAKNKKKKKIDKLFEKIF